jgi:hypothetical protein
MTESQLITYNEKQLENLQTEIDDIDENLKLPYKFLDDTNKIKKVILEKSLQFSHPSGTTSIYLKMPIIYYSSSVLSSIKLNFNILRGRPLNNEHGVSYFTAVIYREELSTLKTDLDMSLNHGKIAISDKKIVYYIDEESRNHHYLKISISDLVSTTYYDVKYTDVSSELGISDDFTYDNMILTELPGTEITYPESTIYLRTSALDQVKLSSGETIVIITSSNSQAPSALRPDLYPDTVGKWSSPVEIGTSGYYMWKYTEA